MDAKRQLAVLTEQWDGCTKCKIHETRGRNEKIVIGGGAAPADFLFVYDTPEAEDMLAGAPMSGRYGGILADLLVDADMPARSFALTPLVGCRPFIVLPAVEDKPAQIRDREADSEEREACAPRLNGVIYAVDPQLIFAVGKNAWEALVRPKDRDGERDFAKAVGKLFYTYVQGRIHTLRYPVLVIPHPRDVVANPSSARHGPIIVATETLIRGKKYVATLTKETRT